MNRDLLLSGRIDRLEEKEKCKERRKGKNNVVVKGVDFASGSAEETVSNIFESELGLDSVVILNTEVITSKSDLKMSVVKLESLEKRGKS